MLITGRVRTLSCDFFLQGLSPFQLPMVLPKAQFNHFSKKAVQICHDKYRGNLIHVPNLSFSLAFSMSTVIRYLSLLSPFPCVLLPSFYLFLLIYTLTISESLPCGPHSGSCWPSMMWGTIIFSIVLVWSDYIVLGWCLSFQGSLWPHWRVDEKVLYSETISLFVWNDKNLKTRKPCD